MGVNITSSQISDDNSSDRRSMDDQNNSPRRSITPSTPGDKFNTKVGNCYFIFSIQVYHVYINFTHLYFSLNTMEIY